MARKKAPKAEPGEECCYDIGGHARLRLRVEGLFVINEDEYEPDELTHEFTTVIPDNNVGKVHNPDRVWSAGEALGHTLGQLARSLREHFADWNDVSIGFEREMREPF
jgi:hypothetical protein